jgi:deltex-like protein
MSTAQWFFYLQNDPRGLLPDGWHPYDFAMNQTVEQLYQQVQQQAQNANKRSRQVLPMTAVSGFQYELDFSQMTQKNMQSHKVRPIARTTNGLPPGSQQQQQQSGSSSAFASPPSAQQQPSQPQSASVFKRNIGNGELLSYTAPDVLHQVQVDETKVFVEVDPPKQKAKAEDEKKQAGSHAHASHDDDCVICLDNLWDGQNQQRIVALIGCKHRFHYDCIHEALTKSSAKCPLCSVSIQQESAKTNTAQGKCPSATMMVSNRPGMNCQGHPGVGTIQLSYRIPSGTQKSYHPHPGVRFSGANRVAYLPDNEEGKKLLARMQYAFGHGLSFMVGTSLTTAQPNVVTWASIHHKTSLSGGTHCFGFPDDTYFDRCNEELDSLGVPQHAECQQWYQSLPIH